MPDNPHISKLLKELAEENYKIVGLPDGISNDTVRFQVERRLDCMDQILIADAVARNDTQVLAHVEYARIVKKDYTEDEVRGIVRDAKEALDRALKKEVGIDD